MLAIARAIDIHCVYLIDTWIMLEKELQNVEERDTSMFEEFVIL